MQNKESFVHWLSSQLGKEQDIIEPKRGLVPGEDILGVAGEEVKKLYTLAVRARQNMVLLAEESGMDQATRDRLMVERTILNASATAIEALMSASVGEQFREELLRRVPRRLATFGHFSFRKGFYIVYQSISLSIRVDNDDEGHVPFPFTVSGEMPQA